MSLDRTRLPNPSFGATSHGSISLDYLGDVAQAVNAKASLDQVPALSTDPTQPDAGISQQLLLTAIAGGAIPVIPRVSYTLSHQISLYPKVRLRGQGASPDGRAGTNTVFKAAVGTPVIFGSSDDGPVHSTGLQDLALDGTDLAAGGACIRAGFLESSFDYVKVTGPGKTASNFPGTVGVDHLAVYPASWINWRTKFTIGGFNVGLQQGGSDSVDAFHYLSGNSINYRQWKSTGSIRAIGNMYDLAYDVAVEIQSPDYQGAGGIYLPAFVARNDIGGIYVQNDQHIRMVQTTAQFPTCWHACSFVGCSVTFGLNANRSAMVVGNGVVGGLISGTIFAYNAGPYDIEFGGIANVGWKLDFISDKAPNQRIKNMSLDCMVDSAGPGGQYNYRTRQIINHDQNPGGTVADAVLNVYGNDIALGLSGLIARFGKARNSAGFDVSFAIGSDNDRSWIAYTNGEQTQSQGLDIRGPLNTAWSFAREGHFVPGADGQRNLGAPGRAIANIYSTSGQLTQSDQAVKTAPTGLPANLLAAARDIEIVWFQYLASVAEKGTDKARKHVGVIAQQLLAALAAHGITEDEAMTWGFIGRDPEFERVEIETAVDRPVMEMQATTNFVTDIVDGKAVRRQQPAEVPVQKMQTLPIVDEAGAPVMETVPERDAAGNYVQEVDGSGQVVMDVAPGQAPRPRLKMTTRQAQAVVPMTTREVQKEVRWVPTGNTILAVRYDQLALLMIAALRQPAA